MEKTGAGSLHVRIESKQYTPDDLRYPGFTIDSNHHITFYYEIPDDAIPLTHTGMRLMQIMARHSETHGGLLIHGALAAQGDAGVIFTGPSGVGKSTLSRELAPPWRSLSDDLTLVVLTDTGYRAHPLPTWSRFEGDVAQDSWRVAESVALTGVCFLERSAEDSEQRLGAGDSVCRLQECTAQAVKLMEKGLNLATIRRLRLRRFDNICRLMQRIPAYALRRNWS